jgi:hypothetical protein
MPTQAIAAYGIQVRLGDGVVPGVAPIAGVTNTAPIAVATTVPHAIVGVTMVTVAGVVGTTAANGTWIAEATGATTLLLRGSVGNGTYTGGGTVTIVSTFAVIAELTNLQDGGVIATLVEVSAHDGGLWTTRIPTLLSGNTLRLSINHVPAHPTHNPLTGLEYLLLTKQRRWFMLVFPDVGHTVWAFEAWVTDFKVTANVADALTAETMLTLTNNVYLNAA